MADTKIASARGTMLALPYTPLARTGSGPVSRAWMVPALVLILPLPFESFQYMIDVPPLYLLSKVWPLLMAPFALYGLLFLRLPYSMLYVLLLVYVLGLTPWLSMVQLPNDFGEAIVASAKVWALDSYFATAALLHLLRPSPAHMRRALMILALLTFAAFWILWIAAPISAYRSDPTESQVFFVENERGYRIVLPIGFALMGLFATAHRFVEQPRFWRVLVLAGGLATMVLVYKQRTAIAACGLLLLYILSSRLPPRWRLATLAGALVVGLVGLQLRPEGLTESLGGSLSVRQLSGGLAFDYIVDHPLRWLFGVGSTTAYSRTTLQDIMGFNFFFLTDLGWLGVLFEFGLVGTVLIACFDLIGWYLADKAGRDGGPWLRAMATYAVYLLLVSVIYSVVYAPGEMATITAIAWYSLRNQATMAAHS